MISISIVQNVVVSFQHYNDGEMTGLASIN
jgi:hypothetical protein